MAHFQAMVDMAKTPADVKKEVGNTVMPSSPAMADKPSVPTYPYGLCLALTEEEMAKLGLDGDLPSVGEMIHLCAMAKVTSVSESEREDTGGNKTKCCRVELQITHLATESEDEENAAYDAAEEKTQARRGRFYSSGDKQAA